jgi:hypothetical protein
MATNKKITQLDELTPATWADDDVIAIVDISAQETKKIQLSTFRGAVAGVSSLNASTPLTVDSATGDVTISVAINGGGTINAVFDEDNMASNSPTALATQQSIKAYVDSQVGTVDTLAEILANGNTSGGTNIVVSSGDVITTNTINETTAASGVTIDGVLVKDGQVDGRDVSVDGTKLDTVETSADVTDATNVLAALVGQEVVATGFTGTLDGVLGGGTPAAITGTALTLTTGATVTTVLDEDNMASNSATALATQQSIKAYVDSQVVTGDTLAEILANGNTTGGTDIVVSSGDVITTNTINETTAASGVTIDSLLVKDGGITGTTGVFSGNLTVDTNTLFVNAANNRVGIGTSSPSQPLQVVTSGATAAGISVTNTTGNANLFLSTANTGTSTFFFGDTDNFQSGLIQYSHTSDSLISRSAGVMTFQTGGANERMRITNSGNVGIGTTAPGTKLEISTSGVATLRINDSSSTTRRVDLSNSGGIALLTARNGATNTGFYVQGGVDSSKYVRFQENLTQFFTSDTERMRITSSGNVGIGTASPSSLLNIYINSLSDREALVLNSNGGVLNGASIDIQRSNVSMGKIDADYFEGMRFYVTDGAGAAATERMRIDSSGKVGIGTASPSSTLDIVDSVTNPIQIKFDSSASAASGRLGVGSTGNAIAVFDDNTVLESRTGGLALGIDNNNPILFYNTASRIERMRIDSIGNVGIGISAPAVPLHISSATPAIRLTDTDDNSDAQIGASAGGLLVLDADIGNEVAGTAILFRVDGGSEKMRIDSSGNVGIGRTSPTNKLEVDGAAALYAASTETRNFEVGYGRTGNGYSYVDLIGDATYTDYGLRIVRNNGGANTASEIIHRGTGSLAFNSQDAGVILLKTSNAERMRIDSSGNVGIGTSAPGGNLHVQGAAGDAVRLYITDGDTTGVANSLIIQKSGTLSLISDRQSGSQLLFGTANTERMRITSAGAILVGKTTGSVTTNGVELRNDFINIFTNRDNVAAQFRRVATSSIQLVQFYGGTDANTVVGAISVSDAATTYNTTSDYRLKEDVQPMVGASDRVMALNPVNFSWKTNGSRVDGFLAHEAQEVVPEAVTGEKDAVDADGNPEYQGIDQSKLVPVLTAALQEALTKIEALEARIVALETA